MFSLTQQGDLLSAPPCHDSLKLRKASRVQKKKRRKKRKKKKLHEQHGPNGGGPELTSHRRPILWKKLLQVYKVESCQQQRRFSSCKHLSLFFLFVCVCVCVFCELFSVFDSRVRVLVPLNRTACLFLSFAVSVTDCAGTVIQ